VDTEFPGIAMFGMSHGRRVRALRLVHPTSGTLRALHDQVPELEHLELTGIAATQPGLATYLQPRSRRRPRPTELRNIGGRFPAPPVRHFQQEPVLQSLGITLGGFMGEQRCSAIALVFAIGCGGGSNTNPGADAADGPSDGNPAQTNLPVDCR